MRERVERRGRGFTPMIHDILERRRGGAAVFQSQMSESTQVGRPELRGRRVIVLCHRLEFADGASRITPMQRQRREDDRPVQTQRQRGRRKATGELIEHLCRAAPRRRTTPASGRRVRA